MRTKLTWAILILLCPFILNAQKTKHFELPSPDGALVLSIDAGEKILWSVKNRGDLLLAPSTVSMTLQDGEVLGANVKVTSSTKKKIDESFRPLNYRKAEIKDHCNELTLNCKGDYGLVFRIYDNAVAYRFFTRKEGELIVMNEEANFNFTADHDAIIPIQHDYRDGQNFNTSFEALYHEMKLSQFPADSFAFLPLLVAAGNNVKAEIMEIDLEDYPGMYLHMNSTGLGFCGVFAPYPLETRVSSRNIIPSKRADYIAKTSGNRAFPWRAVFISKEDKELLDIDLVQLLASPSRLEDVSWIKPGQVSWDWWNATNISHVDFRSGMNTPTYKYYIDFASKYGLPYIILDEGWNVPDDLLKVKPEIDLDELISYGKERGVSLILWCSWKNVLAQMEDAFSFFEAKGVKGMKIDFIDRDDQLAVASTYEIAALAAKHKLIVDYHGIFKPTGLQRTYPNVIGYEGVRGMENNKWANENQPRYCVTLPFIRNQAGPMDYTPGAMRNATRSAFRPVWDNPMGMGTRVNQMAEYVVFDAPLQMLSDNPTIYLREPECTEFISKIPTTYDELLPLDGKVTQYVALAKRKGDTWFVAAMTNWSPREMTLDLSFLDEGVYRAEIFCDGVNADHDATDYRKEIIEVKKGDKLTVKLMDGGGWVARISPL